jgi:predicted DNA binding CopG/RHH family protein
VRTVSTRLIHIGEAASTALAVPAGKEPRAKSLTLRLSETQYERLRRFAFERRLSHQDIIESALLRYLNQQECSA